MTVPSRPAKRVALASLILSIVFFGIVFFVGRWSGFFAVSAVGWVILASVLIWFVLCLQFHQRSLAEQERLDMSQLGKGGSETAIFQTEGEKATLFAIAHRRLVILEKWFLPIFSGIIAVYQIGIGLYLLKTIQAGIETETRGPLICAICMAAVFFVSFLTSRYATGMSGQSSIPEWKPLRSGGSFLLGIAVLSLLLAVGLALAQYQYYAILSALNWIIPVLSVLLGAETALNAVLDIYRPRLKGQYCRSAFDSRLLGVINEPGGIFRTAAGAIDYQFGFTVSQTWFYKLLEKAIVPLVLFGAASLYLLSCIMVLNPNEEAIIEHFGNPLDKAGQVRLVEPGLSFKWPWPIDIAHKYPTKKISELSIGYVPKIDPATGQPERNKPLLWGESHYEKEELLLVAGESQQVGTEAGPVSLGLVIAAVPVQYRVKDLYSFIYNHNQPEKLLESICYRELTRLGASVKVESNEAADANQSLLGAGRADAERLLTSRIQQSADESGLGVEIVFLGLQGIHPPPEVAADYQKVIGAVQTKQATILDAHANRIGLLSTLAGSVEEADELYKLASEYQQAVQNSESEKAEKLGKQLDAAFAGAKGDIFSKLRGAQSYAYEKASLAKAAGERFAGQLLAYRASPEFYRQEQRLAVLEESLQNVRKFIVVADENDREVFIVDVQEKLTPSLYDIAGIEEIRKK